MQALIAVERRTRLFAALCIVGSVVAVIIALDYGGYPFAPYQYWILEYLLRTQDVMGGLFAMVLVLAACWHPLQPLALLLVDAIARRPWLTAAVAFFVLCVGALFVEQAYPLAQDEYAALFQSEAFAAGRLTGQFPLELLGRLIPPFYMNQFLYGSFHTGQVASAYWPGFALILMPFTALGAPWACNPLLASLALVLIGRLAEDLSGDRRARGWAMLLALASPGFTAMAITYFSMTAHLLLNLVFAALLASRTPARIAAAGLVGSLALVLHNPLPHTLFAVPWVIWLAFQPDRHRNLLILAAAYAPVALGVGFGWALLLSDIQGNTLTGLYPQDHDIAHRVLNFFWSWHIKMRTALAAPGADVLAARLAELSRLWTWSLPGLLILAAAGGWSARRDTRARLLGLSFLVTFSGYFFVGFNQGHGWGARYLHPAWGVLPVLAGVFMVQADAARHAVLGRYVAALAALCLFAFTALRAEQIHGYMDLHLANRPPAAPGKRQIVFVTVDVPAYTADLVQNDAFLRNPVWYMVSYGRAADAALMHARFPGAELVHEDARGQVWRLARP
jgi:hypothetical protein